MADVKVELLMAAGVQSTIGTMNSTIGGLTTPLTIASGLIYGDRDSGVNKSGLEYEAGAVVREQQPVSGSRTRTKSNFVRETVESFTISAPFTGGLNVSSNPVVDGDLNLATHYPGMDALLRCVGLTGAADATGTDAHLYTPVASGSEQIASIRYWERRNAPNAHGRNIKDVRASASFKLVPGEVTLVEFDVRGIVDASATATFPASINYAPQDDQTPQYIEEIATLTWGGTARSFQDLEILIEPNLVEIDDASAVLGKRTVFGSERRFELSGTMIVDDASDPEAEYDAMVEAAGGSGDTYIVSIGAATAVTSRCRTHRHTLNGLRPESVKIVELGDSGLKGIEFTAAASSTTANTEYELAIL